MNIKSIVFCSLCVILCLAACAALFCLNISHAVALEQEIRCGIEEHTHTDECYTGDFLVCDKLAHTHDGNCYIVLLRENDINSILSLLGGDSNLSLEQVINDTVFSALNLNENINSPDKPSSEAVSLDQDMVAQLNTTISEENELPDIVLNEKINNAQLLAANDSSAGQSSGSNPSTLAIGDNPSSSNYMANFFVYLDGKWTCIGSLRYSTVENGSRQDYVIPTSQVLELVNGALGTDFTYNSFGISVATSQNSNSYTVSDNLGLGSVNTTIAYYQRSYNTKSARYIHIIPSTASRDSTAFAFYTVTYQYPDGKTAKQIVRGGTTITLPDGNYEWSRNNRTYAAGEAVTITGTSTFTGELTGPVTFVNLNYNVNFPTVSGVTVSTKPTLAGLSSTSITDGYSENASAVIRNVSQTSVNGKVNNNSTNLSRVIQFRGWKVNDSDVILQPNTTLVWEELLQYGAKGSITLTAVWEYAALQTASFYIRFDSVAVDTDGNITGQDSNKYTNELFAAYVAGVDTSMSPTHLTETYGIADKTPDNSYTADQNIRALYGEKADGVYLSAFPSDNAIFADLVQYANTGYLSVDGVAVKAEDLNDKEYAIRWYVFKAQSDAWHIDGKLVRKEGLIHVYKTFAGNKKLIAEAKTDFYIDAIDESTGVTTKLNLENAKTHDTATDTYMWEITNVDYGELWSITEHPHHFADPNVHFSVYSEYNIMDAHGDQSISGVGTSLSVSGMTYALDEGLDEVLRAEFTNIYNKSNSIVIKKQDALTGVSIGGATFRLTQNGKPLRFHYNTTTDSYEFDPENGQHMVLSGTATGYFEISIEKFNYDLGNIIVEEVDSPTGYSPIGNIEIGYIDDEDTIGIIGGNSEMIKYINGILVIGNSTDIMSVTATKKWDCPKNEWQPVTVQLLANDKLVTTVIAGVTPQVVLNDENNWQYTWNNLPVYVNGVRIEWSIKETVIGTEVAKADGSFVNWLASYGIPVQTTGPDGNPHVELSVTNTTKRVMLRLTKTDYHKALLLEGATFLLEAVDKDSNLLPNEIAKTGTTDNSGIITFDNLKCGIRYRLTEQVSPEGYLPLNEYIYFTINEDGSVVVEESYYAEAGNTAYNLTVRNMKSIPLPESGSTGADMFYALGLLLITAAGGMYIYHLRQRRCNH